MKILILLSSFILASSANAQILANDTVKVIKNAQIPGRSHDFVKLTAEVKLIDSQYILITKLSVISNEEIRVDKSRWFTQGEWTIAENRFFLERNVRGYYVHISRNSGGHPPDDADWDKDLKVDKAHPLFDTINLGHHYPFEVGNYSIITEIDYLYKSKKYVAQSSAIWFDVPYLPRNTGFN